MASPGGGNCCSIASCKSNSQKAKENREIISFFRFPKDKVVREEWIRKCSRKKAFSADNKRVCSKHFTLEDYEDHLYAKLMDVRPIKLKKNAVPSLNLPNSAEETERKETMALEERKIIIENLLKSSSSCTETVTSEAHGQISVDVMDAMDVVEVFHEIPLSPAVELTASDLECQHVKTKLNELQEEHDTLKKKHIEDCDAFKNKIIELQNYNNTLEMNIKTVKNHLHECKKQLKEATLTFENQAKVAFKDFLTSNQVVIALKRRSKVKWTQEELSRAFTLRYFSKRCYLYLRQTLHYPLPGISTLQQWAARVNMRNGIMGDVLNIMAVAGQEKTTTQRTVVLSYDEVKVSGTYEYDQKADDIVGPHQYMQVVMARGLFDKWKQPVYIQFDQKITKEILEEIIVKLHQIQYNVVACVSDCGGGNQGLWKELNITDKPFIDKTYFDHPVTSNPIFIFADVPHLLKLLRNWFLDHGFTLNDGAIINKDPIIKLIEGKTEISSCHALTSMHVECKGPERQNVKLAAQLFSHTTATALKQYVPGDNTTLAENVGDFVELVNDWFDVMNSYSPSAAIPTKRPYGMNLEQQDTTLKQMVDTISSMKCGGKEALQVFQKGILISTKSIQGLFSHLQEKLDVKYILTHRLNQDCLENFFSQLRTRGGLHDHPSPLNALYRVRMILLGKNPGIVQKHTNVATTSSTIEPKEVDQYLMASALKQAKIVNMHIQQPSSLLEENIESSSCSTSSSNSSYESFSKSALERDGLIYIAGYLAKKHLKEYSHLGEYTYKTRQKEVVNLHSYSMPTWLQNLSFGGLIQPSDRWMNEVFLMDKYFNKLHKHGQFNGSNKVVKNTTKYILKKTPQIPLNLIKSFCRLRIFIRIKFLNHKREEDKKQKRHHSSTGASSSKYAKKIKKIVN